MLFKLYLSFKTLKIKDFIIYTTTAKINKFKYFKVLYSVQNWSKSITIYFDTSALLIPMMCENFK